MCLPPVPKMRIHNWVIVTKLVQANTKKMLVLKVLLVVRVMLVQYSHVVIIVPPVKSKPIVSKVHGIQLGRIGRALTVPLINIQHQVIPVVPIVPPIRHQQLVLLHVPLVMLVKPQHRDKPVAIVLLVKPQQRVVHVLLVPPTNTQQQAMHLVVIVLLVKPHRQALHRVVIVLLVKHQPLEAHVVIVPLVRTQHQAMYLVPLVLMVNTQQQALGVVLTTHHVMPIV